MKSIVISGSASLQPQMKKWVSFWKSRGYKILDWPQPIPQKEFFEKWPKIHKKFYKALETTDIHFIANENKNGERGYIGNGAFAEISFSAGLNLVRKKKIEIILQQKLSSKNRFSRDIEIWGKTGWLRYFNPAQDPKNGF